MTTQPTTYTGAVGAEPHGDLLPIYPGSISTDIDGIEDGNLDWVKLMGTTLNYQYCVGWSRPVCDPIPAGLTPLQRAAVSKVASTINDNIVAADPLASLGGVTSYCHRRSMTMQVGQSNIWKTFSVREFCRLGRASMKQLSNQ